MSQVSRLIRISGKEPVNTAVQRNILLDVDVEVTGRAVELVDEDEDDGGVLEEVVTAGKKTKANQ